MCNKDLDFAKTRTKEIALSSYRNYHNKVPQHIFKEEFLALQNLLKNNDIVTQKSDKGNPAVIVDKTEYFDKMDSFLNDVCKFENID